ncbi:photoreactivation-associated protein [Escherichia coli]|uniref:Photoreactivation-associated protein n=1 Tax=Escherichia coli TaxID=562 RepID=A0A376K136_ECOLX|nr:photoreactivation-associated protein [Escherichia coli]
MNQQRFDDSTLIRIFALHELHRLKEHGLTRGALNDYHSRYKTRLSGPFPARVPQTWPVCG